MDLISVNDVPPSLAIAILCGITIGFLCLSLEPVPAENEFRLTKLDRFLKNLWSEPFLKYLVLFFVGLSLVGIVMSVLLQSILPLGDLSTSMVKRCESIATVGFTPFVFLFKVLPQYLFYDVMVPLTQSSIVVLWNSVAHILNVISILMEHLSIVLKYVYLSSLIWSEWILQFFVVPVLNLISSVISIIVNTPITLLAKTVKAIQDIFWISYLELRLLFV